MAKSELVCILNMCVLVLRNCVQNSTLADRMSVEEMPATSCLTPNFLPCSKSESSKEHGETLKTWIHHGCSSLYNPFPTVKLRTVGVGTARCAEGKYWQKERQQTAERRGSAGSGASGASEFEEVLVKLVRRRGVESPGGKRGP